MARVEATNERRRPGRPRDPEVDTAINRAVIALLEEVGYAELTIEAVAQRAGVGHTSIYRRWPSKPYMVHEVVFPDLPGTPEWSTDGSFADLLHAFAANVVETLSRAEVRAALPGILADAQADPELSSRLVSRFEPGLRVELRRAAAVAVERGELRAGADVDRIHDAVIGAAMAMPFLGQRVSRRRFVDGLVDVLLDGARVHE